MTTTISDITILLNEKCISYRDSELQRLLQKLDYDDLSLLHYLLSDIAEIAVNEFDRGWQEGYEQAI